MHKYIIYNYGTAQFKLYTCMSVTCVPAQLLHVKHKIWYVHVQTLSHIIFDCPRLPVSTRDT